MQLKVGLSSGVTLSFELPADLEQWKLKEADPTFQSQIRSMGLLHGGSFFVLPAPSAFRRVGYMAEVTWNGKAAGGGNGASSQPSSVRIGYVADDVMTRMTLYSKGSPPMVKFDVRKTGKPRWLAPGGPALRDRRDR